MKKIVVIGIIMLFLVSSLPALAHSTPEPKANQHFRYVIIHGLMNIGGGINISNFQGTYHKKPFINDQGLPGYRAYGSFSCDLKSVGGNDRLGVWFHLHEPILYPEDVHIRVIFFFGEDIPEHYIYGHVIGLIVTPL
jgi:hypothetical protein